MDTNTLPFSVVLTSETLSILQDAGIDPESLLKQKPTKQGLSDEEVLRRLMNPSAPPEEAEESVLTASINLSDQPPAVLLSEEGRKFIRVPMIYKGSWKHGEDDLVIDDAWMQAVLSNFEVDALGYAPPLFLGHPLDTKSVEGAPAEAFLQRMELIDDKLYGLYECVSDDTFSDVEKGRYRYASIEFADIRDKVTGSALGPAIVGCALTNRPFIPNLEQPVAFRLSELNSRCADSRLTVLFEMLTDQTNLSDSAAASVGSDPVAASSTVVSDFTPMPTENLTLTELRSEFDTRVAEIENSYSSRLSEIEARVTQMTEQHDKERSELMSNVAFLQAQLSEAQAEVSAKKLSEKLNRLNGMMLADDVKQEYVQMLSNGQLGEAEERVLSSLERMSEFNKRALTQYGTATPAKLEAKTAPSAFSRIVERNKQLSQKNEG